MNTVAALPPRAKDLPGGVARTAFNAFHEHHSKLAAGLNKQTAVRAWKAMAAHLEREIAELEGTGTPAPAGKKNAAAKGAVTKKAPNTRKGIEAMKKRRKAPEAISQAS